ncbi:hypothetical protein ACQJBY_049618 [Aegilops geniculata]
MSTVISCSLLSGRPAAAPSRSSGNRLPPTTGKAAGVALSCFQRQSRPSSVCCASNPKGDQHVPKTDLPPFSISPVALLHPGSPQGERWQIKEGPEAVSMWFEVPGLSKEDLVVELDEDVLVIRRMKAKAETAAATTDTLAAARAPRTRPGRQRKTVTCTRGYSSRRATTRRPPGRSSPPEF